MLFLPVQRKIDGPTVAKPEAAREEDSFVRAFAGDWSGRGFSLAVWPSRRGAGPCFLEMHQTTESLTIAAVDYAPGPTPGDAPEPSTLAYDQNVADLVSGMSLVRESGMWFVHPASAAERRSGQAITLISTNPDCEPTVASGCVASAEGRCLDTPIAPVNTAPFAIGDAVPRAGTRGAFAPYDLGDLSDKASRCRTSFAADRPDALEGLAPQAVLDDPTCLLRAIVERQVVERLMTASVVSDAAFDLLAPGRAESDMDTCGASFRMTTWLERVREGGVVFDQLQYLQVTTAHFAPSAADPVFVWPQIRVATLRRMPRQQHLGLH